MKHVPAAPAVDPRLHPSDTERLAGLVRSAGSVVALTGAGISVPSGIPDFRSPGTGLWERVDPMEVAHIDTLRSDPARFWGFYGERFATLGAKQPNAAHDALVVMERRGWLGGVVTQNIDMLHRKAGTAELVEIHGSIARCTCMSCDEAVAQAEVRRRLLAGADGASFEEARAGASGDGVPRCEHCGGTLRPDVVLFGEMLPEAAMARASELCAGADLILCIGSSLEVQPAGALPLLTLRSGGALAIITEGPTPLDDLAGVRLRGDVVEELGALVAALELE